MKDSDVQKLKFEVSGYKPMVYEKWILSMERTMSSYHPEISVFLQKSGRQFLTLIDDICGKSA